jgi:hypothetical protein
MRTVTVVRTTAKMPNAHHALEPSQRDNGHVSRRAAASTASFVRTYALRAAADDNVGSVMRRVAYG